MGKQAATKVQAGAEGTGSVREVRSLPHSPAARACEFPQARKDPRGNARGGRGRRLRRDLRTHGSGPNRPLPAGLLRRVRRQGRLLSGGARDGDRPARSDVARGGRRARRAGAAKLRAGLGALLDAARRGARFRPRRDRRGPRGGPGGAGKTCRSAEKGGRFHRSGAARAEDGRSRRRRSPRRGSSPASTRSSIHGSPPGLPTVSAACCRSSCTSPCCPTSAPRPPAPRCRPPGPDARRALDRASSPALH